MRHSRGLVVFPAGGSAADDTGASARILSWPHARPTIRGCCTGVVIIPHQASAAAAPVAASPRNYGPRQGAAHALRARCRYKLRYITSTASIACCQETSTDTRFRVSTPMRIAGLARPPGCVMNTVADIPGFPACGKNTRYCVALKCTSKTSGRR